MTGVVAVWEFRTNATNFTDYDDLHSFLKTKCKKWVFQLEKGDKTGYEHYQGRFSLIKKTTKKALITLTESKFNYLEPTISAESQRTAFYVMKEQTRLKGPESDVDYLKREKLYIPQQFKPLKQNLKPFQNYIATVRPVEDRKINFIYNESGNIGKTFISNVLELLQEGFNCPPINDFKELLQMVCCYCMDNEIRHLGKLFIDMPRAMNKDRLYQMYSGIEYLKSGKLFDMRNHYKSWWIDSPEIWVFSNTEPDLTLMSVDRWNVWVVENDELKTYKPKLERVETAKPVRRYI